MRDITEIIIHCSDTPEGRDDRAKNIRDWHMKGRGWKDIGYHYVIDLDGTIELGRPIEKAGAHCTNHNAKSIGVCYVGGAIWRDGVDENGKPIKGEDGKTKLIPKDTRTAEQKKSLVKLLRELIQKYPKAKIYGHRDFANKACPSFDAKTEYKTLCGK